MPLIVPILRFCLLFLNVYETFKTLKTPPLSVRNTGRPSARATTQRKRNMKGCLAVWIVWCCFATYDRTLDAIVRLFVPFYDELKALVILFFIFTRARGAEPVYLHIIRPLVKPHTVILDSLLDFMSMAGDILFVLGTFPIRLALAWWHNLFAHKDKVHATCADVSGPESHRDREVNVSLPRTPSISVSSSSYPPQAPRRQPSARRLAHRDGTTRRHASDSYQPPNHTQRRFDRTQRSVHEPSVNGRMASSHPIAKGQARNTRPSSNPYQRPSNKPGSQSVPTAHQIWYPPSPSFGGRSESEGSMPAETAVSSASSVETDPLMPAAANSAEVDVTRVEIEEWRLYPPIPAAYPLTPPPAAFPLLHGVPSNRSTVSQRSSIPAPFPFISANGPNEAQSLRQSLPPREPLKRGFNTSSSDGDSMHGGRREHMSVNSVTVEFADDEDDGEGEDDFDVTLQTPMPPINSRTRSHASNVSTPASSVKTRSTALTTADNGSSMRTRTASESSGSVSASDSMSISDSSLMARRMRRVQQAIANAEAGGASRTTVVHHEMLGWMAGMSAPPGDDGYEVTTATTTDSESDNSNSSSDDGGRERGVGKQPRLQPSAHSTPTQPELRPTQAQLNAPMKGPGRTRDVPVPKVATRKSTRLAGLGAAPPISRRVTAPAPGSMHTGVYTAAGVHRHASDRNPAKPK